MGSLQLTTVVACLKKEHVDVGLKWKGGLEWLAEKRAYECWEDDRQNAELKLVERPVDINAEIMSISMTTT